MRHAPLSRRGFLFAAGAGSFVAGASMAQSGEAIPVTAEYDIIVCGGGTSGIPAAVAAARQGARVAVIERYGFLGGNVAFSIMPCWHHLGDHHSGLLTQFARRVEAFGVGPAPLKEGNHIEPEAAFCRWHIEKWFERGKQETGFGSFEVRTYRSLMRHWLASRIAMYFLARETVRLRGEKSADHVGAGSGCGEHIGLEYLEPLAPLVELVGAAV